MAPTRRSRKRETRMDAALDAMSSYGFPRQLVRQTVHQLLKVYGGGSDGWVFIEDSAYTLLIDTLLEKQQASTSAEPNDGLMEDNPGDGHTEAPPAGCSNRALLPCSNTETFDDASSTNQAVDTVSAASETGNKLPIKAVNTVSATCETDCQPAENFAAGEIQETPVPRACSPPGTKLAIKSINTVSSTCETDCQPAGDFAVSEIHETPVPLACSPPLQIKSPQPVERPAHKRRKPYHGWISDEYEEEEVLVEVSPAPLRLRSISSDN